MAVLKEMPLPGVCEEKKVSRLEYKALLVPYSCARKSVYLILQFQHSDFQRQVGRYQPKNA